MIKPVMKYDELLNKLLCLKTKRYFYVIKNHKQCFTGNIKNDVANANLAINSVKCNNTGHITSCAFLYAYNEFYGIAFNPKYLQTRSHEVSKLTSRLSIEQIDLIKTKFLEWIKDADSIKCNLNKHIKLSRIRLFFIFEALLYTGMRAGELASINFKTIALNRFVKSGISSDLYAELIINTEKTSKKREIYLPKNVYDFFVEDNFEFDNNYIAHNFVAFRDWAKLPFFISAHVLRRTKASLMHEFGVDIGTISMVLGNTPDVVRRHYIISSMRNFDACDIGNSYVDDQIIKHNNIYWDREQFELRKEANQ